MYYISEIVIFAILLVLLSQGVQADTKGIVGPSDKYPLGAATMATFYAGENMVINTNYPTNGEFYAGHFYSGTSL